ncbi:YiiX/YebB-like N1pC/P60 family cysteine hydrolase [Pedobacter sp. R20-19]|uniref:YiiX/YebB-like N1pC/P60 family cysteine hydrolase n=1 Tax=Pedobacter sp. R20-19 TaxID=1270196 RepID=UPI0009EA5453|nr:YiiX/YebB-like N1pC/P60 family cysteine hydrolase [Pedobacter sp. R20-19]
MKIFTFITGLLFLASFANAQNVTLNDLENGDLVFVGAEKANLSGAINRVTQKKDSIAFDHIGIIEKSVDSIFVLHASSKKGSIKESIQAFYQSEKVADNKIVVYRLKNNFQKAIPDAILFAEKMLGKPYNWTYILNDSSYYCSDFIERCFRKNHIFTLEPMSFINPKTNKTDEFWMEFYKKQNLEVPEGKLGCNPNGLAASDKLFLAGILSINTY